MPEKVKVYELAKKLGVTSVFLMGKIRKEWKLPVKSHMEALTPDLIEKIQSRMQTPRPLQAPKAPQTKPAGRSRSSKTVAKRRAAQRAPLRAAALRVATLRPADRTSADAAANLPVAGRTPKQASGAALTETAGRTQKSAIAKNRPAGESKAASHDKDKKPAEKAGRSIIRRKKADQTSLSQLAALKAAKQQAVLLEEEEEKSAKEAPAPSLEKLFDHASGEGGPESGGGKEDKKPSKKPSGSSDKSSAKFQAADFRKREVVFQPKKKRLGPSGSSKKTKLTLPKAHKRVVRVHGEMTLKELALAMKIKSSALVKKLKSEGFDPKAKQNILDFETIALTVPAFGFEAQNTKKTEADLLKSLAVKEVLPEKTKPPVVTIMGHVDHGKTTLLDFIRKSRTAAGEAGGITQHIGAYSVPVKNQFVTFIDTPGHEAFTAMRSRGARVTDIVVIVVSAADGVMPQTIEALNHAKAAGTPLVVAVNKMDLEGADAEKVKKQMSEQGIVSEEWGGETGFVPVSAVKGDGVQDLLERILITAELQELKFRPGKPAEGTVIEARLEKGRGAVVTFLTRDGVLKIGQTVLAGRSMGRVRQIKNDRGEIVTNIQAGFPAEVTGFDLLPKAGDRFDVIKDEKAGRALMEVRERERRTLLNAESGESALSEEEALLKAHFPESRTKELNAVLKADVSGSLEALTASLKKLKGKKAALKIIHAAVGGITESDVLLAAAMGGIVLGFNVRPDAKAAAKAKEKGVKIQTGSVIYDIADRLKPLLLGLLDPETVVEEKGRAEAREIFHISKTGTVAGSYVLSGEIQRNSFVRVVRDGRLVHDGKIASLKRFKEDAKEVKAGFECGLSIENFNDVKPKDVLETYIKKQVQRTEI